MSVKVASLAASLLMCNKTQVSSVDVTTRPNIDLELEQWMSNQFNQLTSKGNRNTIIIFHDSGINQICGIGIKHVTENIFAVHTNLHENLQVRPINKKFKGALKTFHTQLAKYLLGGRFLQLKDNVVPIERSSTKCAEVISQAEHLTLVFTKDNRPLVFEREYLYGVEGKGLICLDWES